MLSDFRANKKDLTIYNIVVMQKGEIVAEHNWIEPKKQCQYSITKSITSIAAGMAIDDGILSLEDNVADSFKDFKDINLEPYKKIKVKHLLSMSIGQENTALMVDERDKTDPKRWLNYSFNQKIICEPGSRFQYTNTAPYILGIMISKKAKMSLREYLNSRLFIPLDIINPPWEVDGYGNQFGASGIELTTKELARFGQMLLQKGEYKGKRIVSSKWVEEISKPQIETGDKGDDYSHYGYYFWRSSYNSYRADGKLGQLCIVIDDKDTVIAVNSNEESYHLILKNIWEYIYPKL
ncbi:MAG TPA: serine hydrolase [Clostridiales bacterium]|nr:serine hydrolase [Clostridiales bacterium]